MSMTKEPWQQEHPNYEGWLAEYGGKVWGETGEILHPPTEEGKAAADKEACSPLFFFILGFPLSLCDCYHWLDSLSPSLAFVFVRRPHLFCGW